MQGSCEVLRNSPSQHITSWPTRNWRRNIGKATHTIRAKRINVTGELPDWEDLRDAGSAIKADVLARLPELLEQFEAAVIARGGQVHWAADANEANAIVAELVKATGSDEVIKVKSMATQEIGLNEHLEAHGITAYETDLAELIVQLGHDKPSHILVPAIHRNRSEIREIFLREMPDVDPNLGENPAELAAAARKVSAPQVHDDAGRRLRRQFRHRGHGHSDRRGVGGQRANVPDAAENTDHRDGHREDSADVSGSGGLPATAAAVLDGGADEPVHLHVDRRPRPTTVHRSSTWSSSTTVGLPRLPTRSGGKP